MTADGERAFAGDTWQVMVASSGASARECASRAPTRVTAHSTWWCSRQDPRTDLIRRGWWMRQGRIATQPGAVHARAAALDVEVPDGTPFNVDGEVELGPTRFSVRALFAWLRPSA